MYYRIIVDLNSTAIRSQHHHASPRKCRYVLSESSRLKWHKWHDGLTSFLAAAVFRLDVARCQCVCFLLAQAFLGQALPTPHSSHANEYSSRGAVMRSGFVESFANHNQPFGHTRTFLSDAQHPFQHLRAYFDISDKESFPSPSVNILCVQNLPSP